MSTKIIVRKIDTRLGFDYQKKGERSWVTIDSDEFYSVLRMNEDLDCTILSIKDEGEEKCEFYEQSICLRK